MNERQKKIMVPYEEPTDTCPDCSEHPCDCELPAGYTPTPRIDESDSCPACLGEWWRYVKESVKWENHDCPTCNENNQPTRTMNTPTPRTDAAAWPETDLVEGNFSRQLESELTAAREELLKTIEERRQEAIKAAAAKSGLLMWQNCAEDAERELAAVTEQLKAAQDGWHDEITKGLSELRRAESIYTKAQERAEKAEEQRDRLAEALQKLNEYDLGDIPVGVVRRCVEALQSLTQNDKDMARQTLDSE